MNDVERLREKKKEIELMGDSLTSNTIKLQKVIKYLFRFAKPVELFKSSMILKREYKHIWKVKSIKDS
jgi:hypothetical protein